MEERPPRPTTIHPCRLAKRQIYFIDRPGSIQSRVYIGNVSIPRKDKDYFFPAPADTIMGGSLLFAFDA